MIKKENDNYSCDGKILSGEMITLTDPTHDLNFKCLFAQQNTIEISGIDRSTSLLNSLIYQNEIESMQELNTDLVKYNFSKNTYLERLRLYRSDLVFKVKLNDKNDYNLVQLINIEMELDHPDNLKQRLMKYGLSLSNKNRGNNKEEYKALVLGFINCNGDVNLKSNTLFISEFDSQTNTFIQKIENFVDIVIINLFEISKKLENNEKIYILGKEIGNIGKNWLKLLSLRHWAKKLGNNTFEIPNICTDKEINSAIEYLKEIKVDELSKYFLADDDYFDGIIEGAKILAMDMVRQEKEKAKKEAENKKQQMEKKEILLNSEKENDELKKFLDSYKKFNYSLEYYENMANIDFSEMDMEMVIAYWGKEEKYEEKLNILKDFIGKKRKK